MTKILQYWIICITLVAVAAGNRATAQVSRVANVNPMTGEAYDKVYEYDYVDEKPQFPGGNCGLFNFISETREYPYEAYQNHVEGRVLCTFVVGTDGSVGSIAIVRGSGDEQLNREAMRVISVMPRWEAGKIGDRAVPVRCYLPIIFRR